MKKFYLSFYLLLFLLPAFGQNLSLEDLVSATYYPQESFHGYMHKKGFKPGGDQEAGFAYYDRKSKSFLPDISVSRWEEADAVNVSFQTCQQYEATRLKDELTRAGFTQSVLKREGSECTLYQKGALTVEHMVSTKEEKPVYRFVVEKKVLPLQSELSFAEDLLELTSHEYLVSVFGAANVKKERFYYSDEETNNCSVLFHNSNMQVIFIWKNEQAYRDISFLVIGGNLRPEQEKNDHRQVEQNKWKSRQGVTIGMNLRELQSLNNKPLNFFNWDTEQPGLVKENNSGTLNLKSLGIVLDCMDCMPDGSMDSLVSSDVLIRRGDRIFVSSLIVVPQKKQLQLLGRY
jgi:hypothetical protein